VKNLYGLFFSERDENNTCPVAKLKKRSDKNLLKKMNKTLGKNSSILFRCCFLK
jgi:hypothetical protein